MRVLAWLAALALVAGCNNSRVQRTETPRPGWERIKYETDLLSERMRSEAALLKSAENTDSAIREWYEAAHRSLQERIEIPSVFREIIRFDTAAAYAVGYAIALRRGQQLNIELRRRDGTGRVFTEIFEEYPPREDPWFRLVYSRNADESVYRYEAVKDGLHVVRFQPQLGESNEWEITIRAETRLQFPVVGVGLEAIRSVFGDSRDGGQRGHKGVDIFAPRGTPVVAVTDGEISSVRNGGLGGRVVWLRDDERGVLFYYAHLDRQLVRTGQYVHAGDTIGIVGNTGNARRSPPHLHFGVYRSGAVAVNPLPYLKDAGPSVPQPVRADIGNLGRWLTIERDAVTVRTSPDPNAPVMHQIAREDRVLIVGAVSDWHRIRLQDGRSGFIADSLLYGSLE